MKTLLTLLFIISSANAVPLAGTQGKAGTLENPKTDTRLEITKPGEHESFRVDAQGKGGKNPLGFESAGDHEAPPLNELVNQPKP